MHDVVKKISQKALKTSFKALKLKPSAKAIILAFLPDSMFDAEKPHERKAIGFLRENATLSSAVSRDKQERMGFQV